MECTFGLVGQNFTIVASDRSAARSIVVYKQDEDKVKVLDDHKLLGSAGVSADSVAFTEYIQKNVALYEIDHNIALSTQATANFIRVELARALRKGPYQTNLLLGGYDADLGASLYYIDYLASSNKVNFGCHGYASNFILSIFDKEWKQGLTESEALEIVRKCIAELQTRFLVSLPEFVIKIVDANGIRSLDQRK
uniref:Proteasome subunit beta n=1 Tax=Aureoumbra lagunensis TaxID=44058 RepID=A0A7S3NPS0_9STRA|mmetsp:Transcript_9436/g.13068  ORF Transcript_9436/g.13068 Transcript_9436/m.13068 type:complete len:195 (-) Transcript_9436:272-856(-)